MSRNENFQIIKCSSEEEDWQENQHNKLQTENKISIRRLLIWRNAFNSWHDIRCQDINWKLIIKRIERKLWQLFNGNQAYYIKEKHLDKKIALARCF